MKIKKFVISIITFIVCTYLPLLSFATTNKQILIHLDKGTLIVNHEGLGTSFKLPQNSAPTIITLGNKLFSKPKSISQSNQAYQIQYDEINVILSTSKNSVSFEFYPKSDSLIQWPIITESKELNFFLLPEGEGLFVPVQDKIIRSALENEILNHSHMLPYAGLLYKEFALTIIEHTPYRNILKVGSAGRGISFTYDFKRRDNQPVYKISFNFSEANLLSPAKVFRDFLKSNNNFVFLKEKIKLDQDIKKLAGALHIYVWGDGRTAAFLNQLKSLGVKRAWIGYEEKPNLVQNDQWSKTYYVNKEFIELAKKYGYLIGVYDSYNTMMSPTLADSYNTDFGAEFYPKACVIDEQGKIVKGFGERGCTVSMTAMQNDNNSIMTKRLNKFKADGVNSYFLDCHGMLDAYDDYSHLHPQTIFEDINIRLSHMDFLAKQDVVLGTEVAVADTIPYLAFSHGNFATLYFVHYGLMKKKTIYGGWGPAKRPAIFFKPVMADPNYAIRYAPEYRIPLFQAVFHDSIVVTDRWDAPITKFPNLYKQRLLLEWLYGVPSIWNLDIKELKHYSKLLSYLGKDFCEFHSQIMEMELSSFEYLTEDRKVQKVSFDVNHVIVIGNFTNQAYSDVPAQSIKAFYKNKTEKIFAIPDIK